MTNPPAIEQKPGTGVATTDSDAIDLAYSPWVVSGSHSAGQRIAGSAIVRVTIGWVGSQHPHSPID
jgi:hypothetical protein